MDNQPLVSVLMPSYNVGAYIRQCIDSVRNQTLREIEIICVDSGSTDGTLEVLKQAAEEDPRVTLLHSDMKSYGHQMNIGLAAAKGQYIGIVETDDFIAPEMFADLYKFSQNGTVDIVKGNFWKYFSDGIETQKIRNKELDEIPSGPVFRVWDYPRIMRGHPSIWSGIYRRAFLEKINIRFVEERGGGWVDNPFFFETYFAAESIRWTDKPYYFYRQDNPNSSSNRQSDLTIPMRRMLEIMDVADRYQPLDEQMLTIIYGRAFSYIRSSRKRDEFLAQEEKVLPFMRQVASRMDRDVVQRNFGVETRAVYYSLLSPLKTACPVSGRLMFYIGHPYVTSEGAADERAGALIRSIQRTRPDLRLFLLQSNGKQDETIQGCSARKFSSSYGSLCFSFEVINAPEGQTRPDIIETFLKDFGPFDGVITITDDDLKDQISKAHDDHPGTKFIQFGAGHAPLPENHEGDIKACLENLEAELTLPKVEKISFSPEEFALVLEENDSLIRTNRKLSRDDGSSAARELEEIRNSSTYKIGNFFTRIPRNGMMIYWHIKKYGLKKGLERFRESLNE